MSQHQHKSADKSTRYAANEVLIHNHPKGDAPHTHKTWRENVPSEAWLNKHATKPVSSLLRF